MLASSTARCGYKFWAGVKGWRRSCRVSKMEIEIKILLMCQQLGIKAHGGYFLFREREKEKISGRHGDVARNSTVASVYPVM